MYTMEYSQNKSDEVIIADMMVNYGVFLTNGDSSSFERYKKAAIEWAL